MARTLHFVGPMIPPLVSIIMPTRGRPELIRIAIQSVLAQQYERWELIVVSDGGPDISPIIEEHNRCGRIAYVKLPTPRGAAAARNTGISMARGKYIAYLDDDDWYDEHHLATLVSALECSDYLVAYSDSRRVVEIEKGGRWIRAGVQEPYHAVPFNYEALLVNNYIPILAIVHRRDLMEAVGMFDESLEVLEDWELWIRMGKRAEFLRVPDITCSVRWREDGSTTTIGRRRDHYPAAKRIYAMHAEPAAERPDMLAARDQLLSCLEQPFRKTPPTCSIVVVAENAEAALCECLGAIQNATQGVSYEVIVVDNGSRDGTSRVAMDVDMELKIVVLPNALPLGEALQRGAQEARGRFLVFMSPEDLVREYWLRSLVDDAELYLDAAVVCAKRLDTCGTVADVGWRIDGAKVFPEHVGARAWDPHVSSRRTVDMASGVTLVRREVFDRMDGFDETFETMLAVGELSFRAAAHGEVVLQPASVLYATSRPDAAARARDQKRIEAKLRVQDCDTVPPTANQVDKLELVRAAREAMSKNKLDRAASIISELEKVAPQDGETFLARGVLELQLSDNDAALQSFTRALEAGADGQRASLGVSMALVASGRNAEAWEVLSALANRYPDASQVAHMLFRVGALLERWSDLVDPLERYLHHAESDLAMRFATASVCVRRGDFARARRHYDALKDNDPSYSGLRDLARELKVVA